MRRVIQPNDHAVVYYGDGMSGRVQKCAKVLKSHREALAVPVVKREVHLRAQHPGISLGQSCKASARQVL